MKEKISIISSYDFVKHEVNYGSLFQYYALEIFLSERGHSVEWIRFVQKKRIIKKIYEELKRCCNDNYIYNKMCIMKMRDFIRVHLNTTRRECCSTEEIQSVCSESKFIITGSDQVWGAPIEEKFLTFANSNQVRVSYAASFGKKNIDMNMTKTITPWLKMMDFISVREESGVNICKVLGRNDAIVVPDPTLLLEKDNYPVKVPVKEEKYIFGYFLNIKDEYAIPSGKIGDYLERISIDTKFYCCVASGTKYVPRVFRKTRVYPAPMEWLGFYSEAVAILTNSFHGTVFSIIYRKPFIVFLQNGDTAEQNERIYNLLSSFGLLDRICYKDSEIESILNSPINWESVSRKMLQQRNRAVEYIETVGL